MSRSRYLASLAPDQRSELEKRLLARQNGVCFICDDRIDLKLMKGSLDVDHIDPLAKDGLDAENNFALTHASCNRSKGSSNLEVARRLKQFERIQEEAQKDGGRGADLSHVLAKNGGASHKLAASMEGDTLEYSLAGVGDNTIYKVRMLRDKLSQMDSVVAMIPIEYLHHDDRINPRSIGPNLRGLIEEFREGRPQLHVSLAWWAPEDNDTAGRVRVFDGQHKAAAQILLGVKQLPVRIFLKPDINVLLQANTNAGGKLRQVAFDASVMRHLGSTLYVERVEKYRKMRGLQEDDFSFSEKDLVKFYKGESREMERYIIDAQRDSITHSTDNKLLEFIEWSGKLAERPLAYMSMERSFFKVFLYKKALDSPIDEGMSSGTNPRHLEREQIVRLMNLFADVFFVKHWDPDLGGRQLESKISKGEAIPPEHLRAWRITRDEVLGNVVSWIRLVMRNYYSNMGQMMEEDRCMQQVLPQKLWDRIEDFLLSLADLPCWIDKALANTVFGPKQNLEYWDKVFKTGKSPNGIQILATQLNLGEMINRPK